MAKKKKQRNYILLLFISVLCFVLIIGFLTIIFLSKKSELFDIERIVEEAFVEQEVLPSEEVVEEYNDIEYRTEHNIYLKDTKSSEVVTISFAGDILFDSGYAILNSLRQKNQGIHGVFSNDILEKMHDADIFMVNNEFPYTNRGTPTENKQFTFRSDPSNANLLYDMGVDIVSIANNHIYDYGEVSLLDTIDTLNDIHMPYVGAGKTLEEAMAPVYFIANDMKIGILAATQIEKGDTPDTKGATSNSAGVFRCWNSALLLEQIAKIKEECDFLVVYLHWGTESEVEIDWKQREQAKEVVDAGADLVIGNHPHILQKIDFIEEVPVIYSLGNFLFNSKTLDTGIFQVSISKNGINSIQFLAAEQKNCFTSLLSGSEKDRVLSYMDDISDGITIDRDGYIYKK
ncbi:MAG: CapA family protein [Lachnospiraceae bacterium]